MVFWAGILVGALFACLALKIGFYETWAMVFNIVISIYLAIFLRPIIADIVPVGDTPYSNALTIIATALASFVILQGISYTFFTGQFSLSFPKIFDNLGSACLGFLAGFLVWSFVSFLICITPIAQNAFAKKIGFTAQFQKTNVPYISRWCNLVNKVVSKQDDEHTTEQIISELVNSVKKKRRPKPAPSAKPAEPNDVETETTEQELLGPPPEVNVEDI